MNTNLVYRAIADFINSLQADRHDIAHAITLMSAQMPNATPTMIQIFLHAEGLEMEGNGEQLPRLDGMLDPHGAITMGHVVEEEKATTATVPQEQERPVVLMWVHPRIEDAYGLDRHNVKVLCSFHELIPPAKEDFEKRNSDQLVMKLGYGHIDGGFNIHFFEDDDAYVQLFGEFTPDSFIPVRVQLIPNPHEGEEA